MNLTELKQAFQDAIDLLPEIEQFEFSDEFNINGNKKINYPCVWMPIPDSVPLKDTRGNEEFAVSFTVYDTASGKDEAAQLKRIDEMEVFANKIFRNLPQTNDDIIDYDSISKVRADRLHNDKLLGVKVTLTLIIWTGWDCK